MAISIASPALSPDERLRRAAKILAVGAIRYAAQQAGEKYNTIDDRHEDSQDNQHSPEQNAA